MPSPRDPRGEAPDAVDLGPLADVRGDLAQEVEQRLGQHQVVPGGGRLDPLGQAVHPRLGPGAAGVPEPGPQRVGGRRGILGKDRGADAVDGLGVEVELGRQAVEPAVEPIGSRTDGAGPQVPLLAGVAPVDVQPHGRPAPQADRVTGGDQQRCLEPLGKGDHRARGRAVGVVVALDQQGAPLEPRFAVAERGQRLAVGRGGGKVISPHRVQRQAQVGARRRRDGPLARLGLAAEQQHRRGRHGGRPAPQPGGPPGHGGQRRRQRPRPGRNHGRQQPVQPLVEARDAGQVMDDPLVDAQRGAAQRHSVAQLDQPPPAQRRCGRQGAPVGSRQGGHGLTEGRKRRPITPPPPRQSAANRESSSTPAHKSNTPRSNGESPKAATSVSSAEGAGSASAASCSARSSSSAEGSAAAPSPPPDCALSTALRTALRTQPSAASRYRRLASIQSSFGMGVLS